jgi:hypothetical protein
MTRLPALLLVGAWASAGAGVVDHCATLLGSLGVELRHARQLPRGARTTFTCPRDTSPLVGADRSRVLAALGTPDLAAPLAEGAGLRWTYRFGPPPAADSERPAGEPELSFDFDARFAIVGVECRRRP